MRSKQSSVRSTSVDRKAIKVAPTLAEKNKQTSRVAKALEMDEPVRKETEIEGEIRLLEEAANELQGLQTRLAEHLNESGVLKNPGPVEELCASAAPESSMGMRLRTLLGQLQIMHRDLDDVYNRLAV